MAGAFHWVPRYFYREIASRQFTELTDYQFGWLERLKLRALENGGYLPAAESELWRLAGAKTSGYFQREAASVLSFFESRTVDQAWMYNAEMVRDLTERNRKLRPPDAEQSLLSLSLPGIGFAVTDTKDLTASTERCFEFYVDLFAHSRTNYTLTEQRRHKGELRLLERLKMRRGDLKAAEQDCRDAIANLRLSDWHWKNNHVGWEQIFRSKDLFEERLDMGMGGEAALVPAKREPYAAPTPPARIAIARQVVGPPDDPWLKILGKLRTTVDAHSFLTWLKPTHFWAQQGETLYVAIPDAMFDHLGRKYAAEITRAAAESGLGVVKVELIVVPPAAMEAMAL